MSKRNNQDQKANLALAMATGHTVKAWAESRNVADRTARSWSHSPEVVHQVEAIRREAIECAIGKLSDRAVAAAERIGHLATEAASEAVQLQAARAVLADLMGMSDYAAIEKRLADVERRIAHAQQPDPQQQGAAHRPG